MDTGIYVVIFRWDTDETIVFSVEVESPRDGHATFEAREKLYQMNPQLHYHSDEIFIESVHGPFRKF